MNNLPQYLSDYNFLFSLFIFFPFLSNRDVFFPAPRRVLCNPVIAMAPLLSTPSSMDSAHKILLSGIAAMDAAYSSSSQPWYPNATCLLLPVTAMMTSSTL